MPDNTLTECCGSFCSEAGCCPFPSEPVEKRWRFGEAMAIAIRVMDALRPHCERIELAGSLRRRRSAVKDIEIVALPKPYNAGGLFGDDGIASVVNKWEKVKGDLPCKYTQRVLPEGIKLDLFLPAPNTFGLIHAIRTGSAEFSHKVLAAGWKQKGYTSDKGVLYDSAGESVFIRDEKELFAMIGLRVVDPADREWPFVKEREYRMM